MKHLIFKWLLLDSCQESPGRDKAKNIITEKSNLRAVLLLIEKMLLSCVTSHSEDVAARGSTGLTNEQK